MDFQIHASMGKQASMGTVCEYGNFVCEYVFTFLCEYGVLMEACEYGFTNPCEYGTKSKRVSLRNSHASMNSFDSCEYAESHASMIRPCEYGILQFHASLNIVHASMPNVGHASM